MSLLNGFLSSWTALVAATQHRARNTFKPAISHSEILWGGKNFTVKFSLNSDPNVSIDTWSRKALTVECARARSYISLEREARREARLNQNWSCPVFLLLCIKLKFSPYCPGTLAGLNQYFLVAHRSCLFLLQKFFCEVLPL